MANTSGLRDTELMELARDMRDTHPQNDREYIEKWLAFQARWIELMPMVPLYTNIYYDFYTDAVQGYNIDLYSSWALAIPYVTVGEAAAEE
ncbi:hypothetical protein LJC74_03295 [Eubacteriales bacterium OttesenSCG-928-A19]|nr:hypothetical protein [Eubacteriales bacterium OttesenSCG-928-A19]